MSACVFFMNNLGFGVQGLSRGLFDWGSSGKEGAGVDPCNKHSRAYESTCVPSTTRSLEPI